MYRQLPQPRSRGSSRAIVALSCSPPSSSNTRPHAAFKGGGGSGRGGCRSSLAKIAFSESRRGAARGNRDRHRLCGGAVWYSEPHTLYDARARPARSRQNTGIDTRPTRAHVATTKNGRQIAGLFYSAICTGSPRHARPIIPSRDGENPIAALLWRVLYLS